MQFTAHFSALGDMLRQLGSLLVFSLAMAGTGSAQCPDGTPPPCAGRPALASARSVAVLTFRALSRDSSDLYLVEGLSDLISSRLQQVSRLLVKSRSFVRWREAARPPATAFGSDFVLTGTVLRTTGRLQVTAELARAASGDAVWSQRYDRADGDVLAVEADIAGNVARVILGARLSTAERASLLMRATTNQAAYDHFIRGNYLLARRTVDEVAQAAAEYEAAVRLDSGFTAAVARIAYAYGVFLVWGWEHPTLTHDRLLAAGLAASDVALRRDSTTSDAWMARGYLLSVRQPRTLEGVREVFERAIQLDPRNAEAHHQFGAVLRLMGRDAEALAELRAALQLEPARSVTLLLLAEIALAQRQLEEAAYVLDTAEASAGGFPYPLLTRARVRSLLGDNSGALADAVASLRLSRGADSVRAAMIVAFVSARAGDTATARADLARLDARPEHDPLLDPQTAVYLGMAYAALGDREQALRALQRSSPRGARLWFYLRWPEFDTVRADSQFARLVAEARPPMSFER